jgi:hypothetical protein
MLAPHLERCSSAQRGIKRDVIPAVASGPRLDIAAPFAIGAGLAAASGDLAGQFVERRIQLAGVELVGGVDFLAALPPFGIGVREDRLRRRLGFAGVGSFLARFAGY